MGNRSEQRLPARPLTISLPTEDYERLVALKERCQKRGLRVSLSLLVAHAVHGLLERTGDRGVVDVSASRSSGE